jgi:hypothetical protein
MIVVVNSSPLIFLSVINALGYAQAQNLPIIGTLGILLLAKTDGLISEARSLLDRLVAFGMRLDKTSYQDILNLAGE